MYTDNLVFSQVMEHLPMHTFRRCVQRYHGNHKIKSFTCLDQFRCMAFAQLTYRESLRDIEACLRAQQNKLYHMGIRGGISRNTLANANKTRDWRIYADFAQTLIHTARKLYVDEDFGVELDNTIYALDATTIDLCLSVFPWAQFRSTKGAIKLHTLMDLRGNIPTFIHVSDGKLHDVNVLDLLVPEVGAFTLWTAVTWILPGSTRFAAVPPSSSFAENPIYNADGYIRIRWTKARGSNAIRQSCSLASILPRTIRTNYVASNTTTNRPAKHLSF